MFMHMFYDKILEIICIACVKYGFWKEKNLKYIQAEILKINKFGKTSKNNRNYISQRQLKVENKVLKGTNAEDDVISKGGRM